NASGTSLSTPLVGGSIAVILSAHPDWTPIMVREVLLMTADNSDNPDNLYGWGLIDVMAAINYEFLPGDVDRDGNVRVTDIVQIIRFILILDIPNEYEQWAADVNGDGSIDISDIINIINIILCIDY
ncbi:MAG: S8 family serine peptidase, partial [Candidatus Marinimicrobia bacterium]|nr:S8 family serine peptidase [Candidatus Neomarinimicrobiota bacterium]